LLVQLTFYAVNIEFLKFSLIFTGVYDIMCAGDSMFTKIRLKNFRSFDNVELDLMGKRNSPKNLAMIYGENGSGKSNLMSAFVFLSETLATLDVRDIYEELLNKAALFADENLKNMVQQRIKSGMRDIESIIEDVRMAGCNAPVILEFDFQIDGNQGQYIIHLGESEIIYERLEYLLTKRKGVYFECSNNGVSINNAVTKEKELLKDIKYAAKRFWGKHSLLAILLHEVEDKSEAYAKNNLSNNLLDVLSMFIGVSSYLKIGTRKWDDSPHLVPILEDPNKGRISLSNEYRLDAAEEFFTSIFKFINKNINKVYYKRTYNDKFIDYELYFEKLIANKYRHIAFSKESTGNHQILKVLCYLLSACFGGIVIMDEMDSEIHDYLFKTILEEIYPHINGQVIMTTHNTVLMETSFARDVTYIINVDDNGHKTVNSIADYEKRTSGNNNVRSKYFSNEYGGLPTGQPKDIGDLLSRMAELLFPDNE